MVDIQLIINVVKWTNRDRKNCPSKTQTKKQMKYKVDSVQSVKTRPGPNKERSQPAARSRAGKRRGLHKKHGARCRNTKRGEETHHLQLVATDPAPLLQSLVLRRSGPGCRAPFARGHRLTESQVPHLVLWGERPKTSF